MKSVKPERDGGREAARLEYASVVEPTAGESNGCLGGAAGVVSLLVAGLTAMYSMATLYRAVTENTTYERAENWVEGLVLLAVTGAAAFVGVWCIRRAWRQ